MSNKDRRELRLAERIVRDLRDRIENDTSFPGSDAVDLLCDYYRQALAIVESHRRGLPNPKPEFDIPDHSL
jgi:hypothetical protein